MHYILDLMAGNVILPGEMDFHVWKSWYSIYQNKKKEDVTMKKLITIISIMLASFAPEIISAQTAEEIIPKVIQAHGGEKKLLSVGNLVVKGKAERPDNTGPKVTFQFVLKYPEKYHKSYKIQMNDNQSTQAVFASNGMTHWNVNPMFGIEEPAELSFFEALEIKHELDSLIPFIEKDKIRFVEYIGSHEEDKKVYFVLKVEYKDGFSADYFIDKESFLISKRRQIHRSDDGQEREQIFMISDYRDVDGIRFPFDLRTTMSGMVYTIDSYEINVNDLDDSIFEMPKK
jgi:hypothetical protein